MKSREPRDRPRGLLTRRATGTHSDTAVGCVVGQTNETPHVGMLDRRPCEICNLYLLPPPRNINLVTFYPRVKESARIPPAGAWILGVNLPFPSPVTSPALVW
ncbi:hypothetical protein VULLAG_LOCUS6971 [Vulpes lagopus]